MPNLKIIPGNAPTLNTSLGECFGEGKQSESTGNRGTITLDAKLKKKWERSVVKSMSDYIAFDWEDNDTEFCESAMEAIIKLMDRAYQEGLREGATNPYC